MYTTPKACYRKAPVRRETFEEEMQRKLDQVRRVSPSMLATVKMGISTINKDLVPGKAKFIKEVSRV